MAFTETRIQPPRVHVRQDGSTRGAPATYLPFGLEEEVGLNDDFLGRELLTLDSFPPGPGPSFPRPSMGLLHDSVASAGETRDCFFDDEKANNAPNLAFALPPLVPPCRFCPMDALLLAAGPTGVNRNEWGTFRGGSASAGASLPLARRRRRREEDETRRGVEASLSIPVFIGITVLGTP